MNRAVFLDRDGIINELVYYPEVDTIDTPLDASNIRLVFGVSSLIKRVKEIGYMVFVISNQPGVALKKITVSRFEEIKKKIKSLLLKEGATVDGEYYCLHHPFAIDKAYKRNCRCRKPKIGLFKQAAEDHNIDLSKSWFIGDGIGDIKAGHTANCKTILRGMSDQGGFHALVERELKGIKPDFVIKKLDEAADIIEDYENR